MRPDVDTWQLCGSTNEAKHTLAAGASIELRSSPALAPHSIVRLRVSGGGALLDSFMVAGEEQLMAPGVRASLFMVGGDFRDVALPVLREGKRVAVTLRNPGPNVLAISAAIDVLPLVRK